MPRNKDKELQRKIKSMLDNHKEFKGYALKVDVNDGKVQLSGIVDTLSDKKRAIEEISRLDNVKAVESSLAISTDGSITDAGVNMEVSEELEADPRVNSKNVSVESIKGRVFLRGQVDSKEEKKAAIEAASKARGVREVVSELNLRSVGYNVSDLEAIFHNQVNNDGD